MMTTPRDADQSSNVDRRQFLRRVGGTGLAVAGSCGLAAWLHDPTGTAGLPETPTVELPAGGFAVPEDPGTPKLVVARGTNVAEMVRRCLDALGGIRRVIQPGDRVVLKPNAAFDRPPGMGATTNPEIVRTVAKMCLAAGAEKVRVVDNPINAPARCFEITGIGPAARQAGAEVLLPNEADFVALRTPSASVLAEWPFFWRPFADATKVIGLPVAKDHNLCSASLGLKNWYGLLGGRRNRLHQAIHETVSDLGLMMKPTLVIMDGTRTLMRGGPTGGSPLQVKQTDVIAAATDQVALDGWSYEHLLGRDPATLTYLQMAETKGIGRRISKRSEIGDLGAI